MKILIIEDEYRTADLIARLLKQYDNSISILGVIDSVKSGIEWFVNRTEIPDLVMADIQLSDGSSFDLFEQVNAELPVIFITAYNEYVLDAFRLNSIDYLLKPLSFTELKKALDKYIRTRDTYLRINLKEVGQWAIPGRKAYKKRFLVRSGNGFKSVLADEIASFQAEEGIVFGYLFNGGRCIIEQNLSELIKILDPEVFFQLSRNTIVNISAIGKMANYFNRRVIIQILPDNREVIVSRERVQFFKEWLNG